MKLLVGLPVDEVAGELVWVGFVYGLRLRVGGVAGGWGCGRAVAGGEEGVLAARVSAFLGGLGLDA